MEVTIQERLNKPNFSTIVRSFDSRNKHNLEEQKSHFSSEPSVKYKQA